MMCLSLIFSGCSHSSEQEIAVANAEIKGAKSTLLTTLDSDLHLLKIINEGKNQKLKNEIYRMILLKISSLQSLGIQGLSSEQLDLISVNQLCRVNVFLEKNEKSFFAQEEASQTEFLHAVYQRSMLNQAGYIKKLKDEKAYFPTDDCLRELGIPNEFRDRKEFKAKVE